MGKLHATIMLGEERKVQRNEILETLLRRITELEEENTMLRRDLSIATGACNKYMADADRGAAEITQLQSDIVTLLSKMTVEQSRRPTQKDDSFLPDTPFVVVLIDGSQSMLQSAHIQQGNGGGRKAARRFHDHLTQYLTQRKVFRNHWRLIIKFYASMSTLGTSYLKSETIPDLATWRAFIQGFNEEYPLCYFIDAGEDSINFKHKIQDQLEVFFGHRDCQHTVLVGSSDGSYAGFLRQYMKSDDLCGRITVIEAIPFPGEFHQLSDRFLPPCKDNLFPPSTNPTVQAPLPSSSKRCVSSPVCGTSITADTNSTPISTSASIPKNRSISTPTPSRLPIHLQLPKRHFASRSASAKIPITPSTQPPSSKPRLTSFLHPTRQPRIVQPTQENNQLIRRKPLAERQIRSSLPRQRSTFFESSGQRVNTRVHGNTYSEMYL